MDFVYASPSAHQYCSVLGMRRSFASGSRCDPHTTVCDCFRLFDWAFCFAVPLMDWQCMCLTACYPLDPGECLLVLLP